MTQFLATLHSTNSSRGGIAIVDSQHGLMWMQSDDLSKHVLSHQIRGITCHDKNVVVTTPASILFFTIEPSSNKNIFKLNKEIIIPEWLIGSDKQADLLGVLSSLKRGLIYVANNRFNSIDIFSLDGVFSGRRFLHEISSFFLPPKVISGGFRFGHIRGICEAPNGAILLSIHDANSSNRGCVVNYDNGEVLFEGLQSPHSILFSENNFIIQEVGVAQISAYTLDHKKWPTNKLDWKSSYEPAGSNVSKLNHYFRGLTLIEGKLYCGVYFARQSLDKSIPSRIISFDAKTGLRDDCEVLLPSCKEFLNPRVFFLSPLSFKLGKIDSPRISLNGTVIDDLSFSLVKTVDNDLSFPLVKTVDDSETESKEERISKLPVVTLSGVSLSYKRTAVSHFSLKKHLRKAKEFKALSNISFTIFEGETVGIIGRNGSGKSTVSMLISGALEVDSGLLKIQGRVQLLSIGLGFQAKLTGRENVYINGALLGLSRKVVDEKLPELIKFSEIGDFIDEPVRTYSAGMRSRLGFAIATAVRPDILILDEVMSTGDAAFRKKADRRMTTMREQTKTIIMVSHNSNQIKRMCSRVIWLNKGVLMMDGTPEDVLPHYDEFCDHSSQSLG